MKKSSFVLFLLFSAYIQLLSGQINIIYSDPYKNYELGLELFNKEKYNAAEEMFINVTSLSTDKESEIYINAQYYTAICAVELYHKNAEFLLKYFMDSYPQNSKVKMAVFQLGKLQYRQKKYDDAIKTFEPVDIYDLTSD